MILRSLLLLTMVIACTSSVQAQDHNWLSGLLAEYDEWVRDPDTSVFSADRAASLFAVALQSPEYLEALGRDPSEIRERLAEGSWRPHPATQHPHVGSIQTYQSIHAYQSGESSRGDSLFQVALRAARDDADRADLYYRRAVSGFGPGPADDLRSSLGYDPAHGPSLYRLAGLFARAVGRPPTIGGRAVYWCASDRYAEVAETSSDERIAETAHRAAAGYLRSAPSMEQAATLGWAPGQTITVGYGDGQSCETTVR